MRYAVDFEGWFAVEAADGAEAERKVFDLLNDLLSPHMNGGEEGDWEIGNAEPDEES